MRLLNGLVDGQVADFGLSKVLDALSVLPGTKTITGTPQYMAPEVMLTQPQGMRVDIYSAAIVMWEILTGSIPWKGMDIVQIIHQVTQDANKTQKPPPGRPRLDAQHIHSSLPGYVQLMHECWAQFPNERPSTDQCVQQLEAIQLAMRGGWSGVNNYHQRMPNPNAAAYQMDQQVVLLVLPLLSFAMQRLASYFLQECICAGPFWRKTALHTERNARTLTRYICVVCSNMRTLIGYADTSSEMHGLCHTL